MTKILFLTSNRVGDAVLSTGLLRWLVEKYEDSQLTIACGPFGADLFRATPGLERLIIMKKQSWNRHWLALWKECKGTEWDIIVDLRNSLVTRLLRAKKKYYGVRRPGQHKVIENAAALSLKKPPAPFIWLSNEAIFTADKIIPPNKPVLALGPAANWHAKQWPIERFVEFTQRITGKDGALAGASVLIVASDNERDQIAPLLKALPDDQRIELIGHDLLTVAACLKRATLFVGNDSGLMHMAAAVGTKTLGLFGPGYEEIYGPWGSNSAFVRTDKSRDELLAMTKAPATRDANLMESLNVSSVIDAANKLLG